MSSRFRKLAREMSANAEAHDELEAKFVERFNAIAKAEIERRVGHIVDENARLTAELAALQGQS